MTGNEVDIYDKYEWLRLTEQENALDYLEKTFCFIKRVSENVIDWKWVIISLHSALYGFAICATKGGNYREVTKEGEGDWLINIKKSLRRVRDKELMHSLGGNHLELSKEQEKAIALLIELRNRMVHYIPCGWSIEISGLPKMTIDILEIIDVIVLNNLSYNFNDSQFNRIKLIISEIKNILSGKGESLC